MQSDKLNDAMKAAYLKGRAMGLSHDDYIAYLRLAADTLKRQGPAKYGAAS